MNTTKARVTNKLVNAIISMPKKCHKRRWPLGARQCTHWSVTDHCIGIASLAFFSVGWKLGSPHS